MARIIGFGILFLILLGNAAYAGPASVISGEPMTSSTAHQVGLGWPSVYYEWWHSGNPDWALGGELVYGDWSGEFSNVEIGGAFNVPFRWHLMESGITDVGFRVAPGVLVGETGGKNERFVFGARAEIGVPVSVDLHPKVNLVTGGVVPATFMWVKGADPFVVIPILGQIGVEVAATPTIAPWLLLQLGPGLAFGDFGAEVEFAFRVWMGATFF